ncbi:hypothetical protein IAT38_002237 [Cryptococcus sp. DSM 104549]
MEPKPAVAQLDHSYSATTPPDPEPAYQGGGGMSRFITPGGNPIDYSQPGFPVFHRKFANPSALGLMAFSASAFCLNLYNLQVRGVDKNNVILGMALGYGGIGQTLAGILEWASGNTFAATTFTSYGCFWFSFSTFLIPQFEVAASYGKDLVMFENAMGLYLATWGMITFIFLIASLGSSVALIAVFVTLDCHFFILAGGYLTQSETTIKVGACFGFATAACGLYVCMAAMLTKDTSYFTVPVWDVSPGRKHQ